jgi:hypothetical protein
LESEFGQHFHTFSGLIFYGRPCTNIILHIKLFNLQDRVKNVGLQFAITLWLSFSFIFKKQTLENYFHLPFALPKYKRNWGRNSNFDELSITFSKFDARQDAWSWRPFKFKHHLFLATSFTGHKKTNYLIIMNMDFLLSFYSKTILKMLSLLTARIIDTSFSNHASRKREKKYKECDGIEKQ